MASAEDLPRPEPLPLVDGMPRRRPRATASSPTPPCSAPRSPARAWPTPDEPTVVVDAPEAAASAAPPEWLADDLVVETDDDEPSPAPLALGDPRRAARRARRRRRGVRLHASSAPRATRSPTSRAMTEAAATRRGRGARVRGRDRQESREDGTTPGTVLDTRARRRRAARRGRHAHADHLARQHAGAGAHRPGRQDPRGGHPDPRRRRAASRPRSPRRSPRTSRRAW